MNITKGEKHLDMRGVLNTYDCGCMVKTDGAVCTYIQYCPKHAAAPAMYEALKAQLDAFNRIQKLCPTMFNILIPEQKKSWEIMQDACIKSEQALYQAENK